MLSYANTTSTNVSRIIQDRKPVGGRKHAHATTNLAHTPTRPHHTVSYNSDDAGLAAVTTATFRPGAASHRKLALHTPMFSPSVGIYHPMAAASVSMAVWQERKLRVVLVALTTLGYVQRRETLGRGLTASEAYALL